MSHNFMQELSMVRKITINNVEMNLADLDLEKLTHEQAKDIAEIEVLQQQIELMNGSLTIGDVSLGNLRPNVNNGMTPNQYISSLTYEIQKYQKEVELMKLKLQFKQQLMAYKTAAKRLDNPTQYEKPNPLIGCSQSMCGLGPQKNGSLECSIF